MRGLSGDTRCALTEASSQCSRAPRYPSYRSHQILPIVDSTTLWRLLLLLTIVTVDEHSAELGLTRFGWSGQDDDGRPLLCHNPAAATRSYALSISGHERRRREWLAAVGFESVVIVGYPLCASPSSSE